VEENRIGQRNDALAWFWRLDGAGQHPDDDWMQECKSFILIIQFIVDILVKKSTGLIGIVRMPDTVSG
jgi:hypothetical protein